MGADVLGGKIAIIQSIYRRHSRYSAVTEWHITYIHDSERKLLEEALGKPVVKEEEIGRLYRLAEEEGFLSFWRSSYGGIRRSYFPDKETLIKFLEKHGYEPMHISKARRLLKRLKG